MTPAALNLGQKLGGTRSIPEYIQVVISFGWMAALLTLWQFFPAGSFFLLLIVTAAGAFALYALAHKIPALRSALRIYEFGLELEEQGKSKAFRFDELDCMSAKLTHHQYKHQYIGTKAKIEFLVDGRYTPYTCECEYRRNSRSEQCVMLALDLCSQAIQSRLLAELEREGKVRWRDNVSLTEEGIVLSDSAGASRLIAYREIAQWKVVDNDLKIWKAGDALPCLVLGNDTPNFAPLMGLFERLCGATRNIDPSCKVEPVLLAHA